MSKTKRICSIVTAQCQVWLQVSVALLLTGPVFAQFNANVQGTVSDSSGQAVPLASVTLHNVQTGTDSTASTDNAGFYRFTGIVPGTYQVVVQASGFQRAVTSFALNTQQTAGIDVRLEVAHGATQVTITGQALNINPDETRLQVTVSGSQLPELPLPNRGTFNIVKVAPGVVNTTPGQALDNIPIGTVTPAVVANGRPSTANLYRLDGIPLMAVNTYGGVVLTPSPDMVQEISLQTSSFSAETGSSASLVTDIASKSGTNQFHGDVDLTYTSKTFAAHTWNTGHISPYLKKWFSGGLGGPIIKNRTFFFGSFQSIYSQSGTSGIDTYETDQFVDWARQAYPNSANVNQFLARFRPTRDQFISNQSFGRDAFPGTCGTPASRNIPCDLPITAQGYFNQAPKLNGTQYNVRLDHYLRDTKDRVFLNYFRVDQTSDFQSPRPEMDSLTPTNTSYAAANWVHTFTSNLLNQAQFGWTRYYSYFGGVGDNPWITVPFGQQVCCTPFLSYAPPVVTPGGTNEKDHSYRFRDYVGFLKDRHNFRFGFEATHQDYWLDQSAFYARPFFPYYSSLPNFLMDSPDSYALYTISASTGQWEPQIFAAQVMQFALYAQDEWKIRPNLLIS